MKQALSEAAGDEGILGNDGRKGKNTGSWNVIPLYLSTDYTATSWCESDYRGLPLEHYRFGKIIANTIERMGETLYLFKRRLP